MASISVASLDRDELADFFLTSLRVPLPGPQASFDLIPSFRELLEKLGLTKGAAAKNSKDASGSEVLPLLCLLLSWS